MKTIIKASAFMALIAVSGLAVADGALTVGSPAPAIKVATWVKGKPVKSFKKGSVYVVEYWATWCGPCKQSIPHLTELAKKYKGKATFIGVDVWEEQNPTDQAAINKKVAQFVKDFGDKMDYNVAVDDIKGAMAQTWMAAAEQRGIPTAFVVDQNGKIAWIGHPMAGLDEVVAQVIEGKFDSEAFAREMAKQKEAENLAMAEIKPFMDLVKAQKNQDAVAEMDKAFAKNPQLEMQFGMTKFMTMAQFDEPAAYAYADKLSQGVYKENPGALNSLAWIVVDDKSTIKSRNYDLAIKWAEQGAALTKDGDMTQAYVLDTLAYAHFRAGHLEKAIEIQEKALASAKAQKNFDAATLKEIADRLTLFKTKRG